MKRLYLSIFVLGLLQAVTAGAQNAAMPPNLDAAIEYLKTSWTGAELDAFRKEPEALAVAHQHYASGAWIRDTWLPAGGSSPLRAHFDSLGVTHTDDMSTIILSSLHRSLNRKELQVGRQVEQAKTYWKEIDECDAALKSKAQAVYEKYREGDSITVTYPVDTAYGRRNAVVYNCPRPEWKLDAKRDLIIKGTIVSKYTVEDATKAFFEIRVDSMNRSDTPVMGSPLSPGATMRVALYGLRID